MQEAVIILVAVIVGYVLGLLNGGVKVSVQNVPDMVKEDDVAYPSFIVGSKEHLEYIAKIRRENNKE